MTDELFRGTADDVYAEFYPYYAELCALSELRKKRGCGVPVYSGWGGHSLLYLNGVRLDRDAGHPTLKLCAPDAEPRRHGVGLSVNSHYKNANWVAAEGSDFVWRGALAPGERLSAEAYERTQDYAKSVGVLDGVTFHDELFRDKPPGMSDRDYMYEISVATDYAVRFGRNTYRARIPLDHLRMAKIVRYLNDLNAPYRDGGKIFQWRLFNNNCSHVAHNALAEADVWAPWPTGEWPVTAVFRFPVPKNEFVDLMLRANDLPIEDPKAIYHDETARRALLESETLPTAPGALAISAGAIADNDVYHTRRLKLIFYDKSFLRPYWRHFSRIFREPRYTDLRANLAHFASLYRLAREKSASLTGDDAERVECARFRACYRRNIEREAERVGKILASLDQVAVPHAVAGPGARL
jgi:hypothetical protein